MLSITLLALLTINHVPVSFASYAHGTGLFPRQDEPFQLPDYSYEGTIGPVNWHGIQPSYATCATGQNQSPINFSPGDLEVVPAGGVNLTLPLDQTPTFLNRGVNVEVEIEGTTIVDGVTFNLQQFHYHVPSEHRFNDEQFPVEVHLVHGAEDDPMQIAVIGFVFEVTRRQNEVNRGASRFFSIPLQSVTEIPEPGDSVTLPPLKKRAVKQLEDAIRALPFSTYSGSLTTPPCTEGVTWLLSTEPLSIAVDTYNDLKDVLGFNSRFTQGALGSQNLIDLACDQLAALGE